MASEDIKEAKLFRAVYSNRQLEEVLVDFWCNHFNVDVAKNVQQTQNLEHLLIGAYERDAIRPHVFGHFKPAQLPPGFNRQAVNQWAETVRGKVFDSNRWHGTVQLTSGEVGRESQRMWAAGPRIGHHKRFERNFQWLWRIRYLR